MKGPSLCDPLDEFYKPAGLALPSVELLEVDQIPQPYKDLLVHKSDMTPKLETFHGQRIHLEVLETRKTETGFSRQVVLVLDGDGKPVEFGAIRIHVDVFDPDARRLIREGRQPLGTILKMLHIEHASDPRAFLRVTSDPVINSALHLSRSHSLYGRQNVISDSRHRTLAEMIEILPP